MKYRYDHSLDSPERTRRHGEIIRQKKFLKRLYESWYSIFIEEMKHLPNDRIVELGSGGGFFKELVPHAVCTDMLELQTNDMTCSALAMPFADHSLGGLFMIDPMHHLPDSELFLREASRVLAKNGKMVMIEPANSLWGRFIYKNFHHEPFNPEGGWSIPPSGPLSGANGALPWIVFERDRERFKNIFPQLLIEAIEYHNPLGYLLTGGVSRTQILPDCAFPTLKRIDTLLPKLSKHISMFMVVKITRQ